MRGRQLQGHADVEWLIKVQTELDNLEVTGDSQRLVFTLFGAAGILISLGGMRGITLLQLLGILCAVGASGFLVWDIRRARRRTLLERALADYEDANGETPPEIMP
ncbi:MAG: hypothetical protein ACWGPR_12365 [Candidatus Deferrimicrobiaceae bacterium]